MQAWQVPGSSSFKSQQDALDHLRVVTNGRLDITLFGAEAIVGYEQTLDGLKAGTFEVAANVAAFYEGKDPGFAILFNMPGIWESPYYVNIWCAQFGGDQIFSDAYAPYNVHYVGPTINHGEPLMSKVPIRTLADIKGLKIRGAPGLEQGIWNTFGASTMALPGSEIYTALQTGVLDAAAFVTVSDDYDIGLHEVAKYILWPSIHSPTANSDIGVNMDAWNTLPPDLQAAFESMVLEANYNLDYYAMGSDYDSLAKMEATGVTRTQLSADDMETARQKSVALAEEWGTHSELAGKVVNSVFDFLRLIGKLK